jgi:pimeloyl-ACP methyl ester carboxylesterase
MVDPLFWGFGVPRGSGRLVLVIPGLFGNDLYLHALRSWLGRLGYRPVRSTLSINAGCYERLSRQAEEHLRAAMSSRAERVAVIGHSRGGMLARAIAARLADQASHLILLGSPVGAFVGMSQGRASRRARRRRGQPAGSPSARSRLPVPRLRLSLRRRSAPPVEPGDSGAVGV